MILRNPEKSLANKILIFDHEGNAVASLHLDCRLQTMALSKDSRKLYGISLLPEPTIVEFDLPKYKYSLIYYFITTNKQISHENLHTVFYTHVYLSCWLYQ